MPIFSFVAEVIHAPSPLARSESLAASEASIAARGSSEWLSGSARNTQ
jgi:hypothetical protein